MAQMSARAVLVLAAAALESTMSTTQDTLLAIESIAELDALIGEITPQERELIARSDLWAESSAVERAELGPEFVQRLHTLTSMHRRGSAPAALATDLFAQGLLLLRLLSVIERQGVSSPELRQKTAEVAQVVADLWLRRAGQAPAEKG
jgi:hypothetical protein